MSKSNIVHVCETIQTNICTKLSIKKFTNITSKQIAECSTLKKSNLADHLLSLITSSDSCEKINDRPIFDGVSFKKNIKDLIETDLKERYSNNTHDSTTTSLQHISEKLEKLQSDISKYVIPTIQ